MNVSMHAGGMHYSDPAVYLYDDDPNYPCLMIHVGDVTIAITAGPNELETMADLADQLCRPAEAIHGERWAVLDGSR